MPISIRAVPRRFARGLGVSMMLLALLGCGKGDDKKKSQGADAAIPVTTTTLRAQPWQDTIQALGTVKARESVTVTAKVSETVQRVNFESGDAVAKGATLVVLTGQQQQASLDALLATAAEADRLYKRQQELIGQQLIARSSLDAQLATRDAARAQVEGVRANLADRVIRAPFAGVLGIRQVSPGALVTPGSVIATLDDIERVYVDFPVPESRLANIASGQSIDATSAAYPGRTFGGKVSVIDGRIDADTRSVVVRGDFDNADRSLRPGMLIEVRLGLPQRQALSIPEIAVVQVGNESYVYRVKPDSTVERADIETGGRNAGRVEVVKGLRAGERIVVDGTGKLRVGAKISGAQKSSDSRVGVAPDREASPAGAATPASVQPTKPERSGG